MFVFFIRQCLGLTALTGDPVICVVVIDSSKENLLVCSRIDLSCSDIDNGVRKGDDEFSFIGHNKAGGKLYPGRPTCALNTKTIPCSPLASG
jgi:hypothetical protein